MGCSSTQRVEQLFIIKVVVVVVVVSGGGDLA